MKRTCSLATLAVLQILAFSHAQDKTAATVTIKALPKPNASSKITIPMNRVQYELRSEYPIAIASDQQLSANATVANLVIGSSESTEPKLVVVQRLWAKDEDEARKLGLDHKIDIQSNSSGLAIASRLEKKATPSPKGDSHSVTLELFIPKSCNANLETSVGNVSAIGLDGSIILATNAGNIFLENLAGAVSGKSSGGNVEARSISGEIDLQTEGGNVSLSDINGKAKVVTAGGNFVVDDYSGEFAGSTAGGNIRVTLRKQPQEDAKIATGGGNIAFHLSKELKLNVKAATEVGRITSPFSDKEREKSLSRTRLSESVNGGGKLLDLSTSAGNISIHYLDEAK